MSSRRIIRCRHAAPSPMKNAPEGNTISTAEHACAMILSLARRIPGASHSMRDGKWDRKSFVGAELFGKTVGIVGVGRVGRNVAERMGAFGMRLLGSDPVISPDVAKESGVELVSLEQLVELSDVISLHAPLTAATRGLFGREMLSKCRPGLLLVNCARGGLMRSCLGRSAALRSMSIRPSRRQRKCGP